MLPPPSVSVHPAMRHDSVASECTFDQYQIFAQRAVSVHPAMRYGSVVSECTFDQEQIFAPWHVIYVLPVANIS
jgi:hypothetical protein